MISLTKYYKLIIILIQCFTSFTISAQVSLHFTGKVEGNSDISWYNIQTNSSAGLSVDNSYFIITAKSNGILIYESRTKNIMLTSGVSIWNRSLLEPIQETVNELNLLSEGDKILIDIKLINAQTSQLEGRLTKTIKWSVDDSDSDSNSGFTVKDKFKINGSIGISAQTANRMGEGSSVPNNFIRADGRTSIAFSDVPFDLGFLLSSEQSAVKQSIHRAHASLNVPLLKQNLKARIDEKIEAAGQEDAPTAAEMEAFKKEIIIEEYPEYEKLELQFESEAGTVLQSKLKRYLELEELEKSDQAKKNLKRYNKLEKSSNLNDEEKKEKFKLHHIIMRYVSLDRDKDEIKAELGDDFLKTKRAYLKYKEAQTYYDGLTIDDYKKHRRSFNVFKLLNKTQQVLNMLQGASVGVSYPNFSKYTLNGLSVNGIHLELTPGKFYLATSYGRSARMTFNNTFSTPSLTLSQRAFGIKAGYGNLGESHLHLSYTNISDKDDLLSIDNPITPESNSLFGLEGGLSLLDNSLMLEAEWAGSLFTRDKNADVVSQDFATEVPLEMLHSKANGTSSFDQAYRFGANWQIEKLGLDIGGEYERLGANFRSLGAPTLLANLVRWKADMRKGFFDNRMQLMVYGQRDNNSLEPVLSSVISSTESFGANIVLAFPKLPQISASYAPFAQRNEVMSTQELQESNTTVTNVSVSYPYSLMDGLRMNTQVTYSDQSLTSNQENANFKNTTYGFNQSINYKSFGLNLGATYAPDQMLSETQQDLRTYNINASFNKEKFRSSLGYQLLSIENKENKYGLLASAGYNISDNISFDLRAQRNIYDSFIGRPSFNEFVVNSGLRVNFGYDGASQAEKLSAPQVEENYNGQYQEEVVLDENIPIERKDEELGPISQSEEKFKDIPRPQEKDINKSEEVLKGFVLESPNKDHHYKVYFHIDNVPNKSFLSMMSLGPVNWLEADSGVFLYFLGQYTSKEEAQRKLEQVKQRGYKDAYIMEFIDGKLFNEDR